MGYDLAPVATQTDWDADHRVRRTVLWEARGRHGYDENHPGDQHPQNHSFLFRLDGLSIGTARLDEIGDRTGAVRPIAIAADLQRQGHGTRLLTLVEATARRLEPERLTVNAAAQDAVSFYTAMGWSAGAWADPYPGGAQIACEQMVKSLTPWGLTRTAQAASQ